MHAKMFVFSGLSWLLADIVAADQLDNYANPDRYHPFDLAQNDPLVETHDGVLLLETDGQAILNDAPAPLIAPIREISVDDGLVRSEVAGRGNVIVTNMNAEFVDQRLAAEGVDLLTGQIRALIEPGEGRLVSAGVTLLRDQVTEANRMADEPIISSLATALAAPAEGELPGPGELSDPEFVVGDLGTFQDNTSRVLIDDTSVEGPLRIFNGARIISDEDDIYKDVVMVVDVQNDGTVSACSGALVAPDLVVTAAHCLCRANAPRVVFGVSSLAPRDVIEVDVAASRSFLDCSIVNNPELLGEAIGTGDIALLRLKESVGEVQLRKISSLGIYSQSAMVRAVGWGSTGTQDAPAKFVIDIAIASYDCSDLPGEADRSFGCRPTHELVAAGFDRDTCSGDSGGPIYVIGQFNLELSVAGVTSRSLDPTGRCGDGGIYVKLFAPEIGAWLVANGVPPASFMQ